MENFIVKMFSKNSSKMTQSIVSLRKFSSSDKSENVRNIMRKQKHIHPYRKVHPWKSLEEFARSLVAGVLYNNDGLVAINKPYGISGRELDASKYDLRRQTSSGVVKEVSYTLSGAIPHIAKELGYSELKLINTPERFTTGVTLLAANDHVEEAVAISLRRAQGLRIIPKTYWAVTTRLPNDLRGERRLAMKMQRSPEGKYQLPIIITTWSEKERERGDIKILNVQFRVISNSTENLSSFVEIKSSTKVWHALRLFAATVLYSPILGDNIYGSRVQNVLGKWVNVSPFVEAAQVPPRLHKDLLDVLKITHGNQPIIPTHLHLREMYLPMYRKKEFNLVLTAPPMPEFTWTCKKLQFKHELFENEEEQVDPQMQSEEHPNLVKYEAAA